MIKRKLIVIIVLVLVGVGGYLLYSKSTDSKQSNNTSVDKLFTVKRGSFDITVPQLGRLEAIKRHDLRVGTSGRGKLTISYAVEDKSEVKKGDVIVKIDPEPFEQSLEELLTSYDNKRKDLVLAEQDLEIGRSTNLSNIKSAAEDLRKAKEELARYEDLDAVQKRKDLQAEISKSEDLVDKAEEEVDIAKENSAAASFEEEKKRLALQKTLEEKEKTLQEAENKLDKAYHALRVFKQYDYPQKIRQLRENLSRSKLNLEKVITQSQGLIIKETQRIRNHKTRINTIKARLKQVREDISKLVVKAPIDGLVYLDNPNRRRWRQPKEIKAGTDVHRREIIAYIPDLSKFVVKTEIPEDYRSRVEVGQPAKLRISAIPDLVMDATVSEIAPIATNVVPWDQNSPKVYATSLNTEADDPRLMPGLTIEIEIIVTTVKDVLYVPIEAVYQREGDNYCRVKTLAGVNEKKIKTGESSIDFIEITEGLSQGDTVLLSRRSAKE